jgi:hypothetical protein
VNRLKQHLTFANVLSCMALFVALGGGVAVAAGKIGPGAVRATNIAKEAVTNPKLKKQAVTSGKIKDGNVNAVDLGTGSVINSKLAKKAVTNAKLGNESVGTSKLAKKAVTEAQLAAESVGTGKIDNEAITAAKLSPSFYLQLIKNVTYVNSASITNAEPNKTATAECPAGKQAIGGGVRLEGELKEVATTASYPFAVGALRPAWTGIAHESGPGPYGDWSIVTFAVCAEL